MTYRDKLLNYAIALALICMTVCVTAVAQEGEGEGEGDPCDPDLTPPIIMLLGDAVVDIECGDAYVDLGATAADVCDGDLTAAIAVGGDVVDAGAVGVYVITYNVSDAASNAADAVTRTVNVADTTVPLITLLGLNPQNITLNDPYSELGATAWDACDGDLTGDIVIDATAVDTTTAGVYSVTYNVSDGAGNAADEVARTVNVVDLPYVTVETWVYLEGAAIDPGGSTHAVPMRTSLNNWRMLPGQTFFDAILGEVIYSPPGQPYNMPPWNYNGTEGDAYDSGGNPDPAVGHANYPATVVDWVLVSVRATPDGAPECQAAALLHSDGTVEIVDNAFCALYPGTYYLVIEHRNHLMVMSHEAIGIVDNKIAYDFRDKDSYGAGVPYVGQKDIGGDYAMLGGNGRQVGVAADTDINMNDLLFLQDALGLAVKYYQISDYDMNGDTNSDDRAIFELNNGQFTSVPSGRN